MLGKLTVNPKEFLARSNISNLYKPKNKRNFKKKNKDEANKLNPKVIHKSKPQHHTEQSSCF